MIDSQVGPYKILSELGSGGMGSVYLGEVTAEAPGVARGDQVAVKIIHPHLLATPGFFKRFLREAELGRQVKHENVVRTFDVDATLVDDKQVNYMAMEYVEGRSLRQLLAELGTVPEALLHEIASQAAAGLAAIHAADIVHRDLKPENLLITNDQRVRIMDLGVAKLQEASIAITKEGQFAGSLLYAAPEQFSRHDVGPRSDLYSLGLMLYELATGTNPFRSDDTAAVISAHLHDVAPRASDVNPDISLFFGEVLAELLKKDPTERMESAAFLRDLLQEGEKSSWWAEREQALRKHERNLPKIRVRRDTELCGRDEEMGQLQDAWSKARRGEGNTVLLEGEPGIGKTRLVDAFLRSLGDEDMHLLYGSYPPSGGIGGISDAIIGMFGSAGLQDALAPYMQETPSLIPAFAALAKHETPPTGSEPLQGDALHAVMTNLARALAAEKPTLWIVDELHYAPAESRNLVLALARAVEEHPIFLLITTRRGGLPEDELTHFSGLDNFRRVPIGRLSPREVIRLVRDALGSEALANRLGAQIAYKSDGVPLFVFEIIRGLKESGLLSQTSDGTYVETGAISEITVPSAIKDLVESRLKDLSQEERAILDVGAVLGFDFDPDLVARVREAKRVQVLETLAAIERRTGVIRANGRSYSFDHQQVQEVLNGSMSEVLQEEYHTLLAEAFAKREGYAEDELDEAEDEDAFFMAWHGLHGSEPRPWMPCLQAALDHLGRAYRTDAALALANRALGGKRLLKGAARVDVLLQKAERLNQLGRRDEESEALSEALKLADTQDDPQQQSRVRRALGWQAHTLGRNDEAERLLAEATELARGADLRDDEVAAASVLGIVYAMSGRHDDARTQFERHLAIARELGDQAGEATATGRVGAMHHSLGNVGEARKFFEESLRLSQQVGNRERQGVNKLNLTETLTFLGETDRAAELGEEARSLLRSIGSMRYAAYAAAYWAGLKELLGEHEAAQRLYDEALTGYKQIQDARNHSLTQIRIGRLMQTRGDLGAAARSLDEARELAETIEAPELVAYAAAQTARLPGGDTAAARGALAQDGSRLEKPQELDAWHAIWRASQDRADLEKAHSILTAMREQAPEEYKDSMIENVPLHREIMEAWEAR